MSKMSELQYDIIYNGEPNPFAQEKIRIKIMLDRIAYQTKPDNFAISSIKKRFAEEADSLTVEIPPSMLLEEIRLGKSYGMAAITPTTNEKGKLSHSAKGFDSQQLFCVDIDNASKEKDENGKFQKLPPDKYITPDKALNICESMGIKPLFMYKSFSYAPDYEKFRLAIMLDEPITDDTERLHVISAFIELFGDAADKSCTNADRVFYGSTPDCILANFTSFERMTNNKQVFLDLYDQQQPKKTIEPTHPSTQTTPHQQSISRAGILAPYGYNPTDYDASPDDLLDLIDPNDCNYDAWRNICASYKSEGGTLEGFLAWCRRYSTDNQRQDEKLFNGMHGKKHTVGTLKEYARQFAPENYITFLRNLNVQQQESIVQARQRKNAEHSSISAQQTMAPAQPPEQKPEQSNLPTNAKSFADFGCYTIPGLTDEEKKPPEFIVEGMIPVGMTVIAGAPKIRKSFLALQMAVAVCNGKPFLGHRTTKTKTVYLDLEGSKNRISERTRLIDPSDLENLQITHNTSNTLGNGGLIAMIKEIHEFEPDVRLFIIDTYSRARGPVKSNGSNAYDVDVVMI